MPEIQLDDDLVDGLTQAKRKPRNFVLLAKGVKPLKLIVQRKPIKAQVIKENKLAFKANVVVHGVCQGEGATMVFFVAEDPGFKLQAVRELIVEQTELPLKPEFRIVPELPQVPSDDEDSPVPGNQQATSQAPTTEAPTKSPAAGAAAQLVAALNKLTPSIKSAVVFDPSRKDELLRGVAAFQSLIKDETKLGEARDKLLEIGKLAQSMNTSQAGESTTQSPSDVEEEEEVEAESEDATLEDDRDLFDTTFALIEPRYLEVLRYQPANASQLRAVMDFANGKAEKGDYDAGVTALERLEGLIDLAEAEVADRTAEAYISDEDESRGVVAFRKALLLWNIAHESVEGAIEQVRDAVLAEFPDTDVSRLDEVLGEFQKRGSLSDALVDCVNAVGDEQRECREIALTLAEEYGAVLDDSEAIDELDQNGFVSVSIRKTLSKALQQLTAELKK